MNPVKIILGLIPLALFSLLSNELQPGWAALIGLVAALVVVLADLRGGVKVVPAAAAVILAAFVAIAFLGGPGAEAFLASFGRSTATFLLAAFIIVTAFIAPFTSAYARQTVPHQYWASEKFRSENRRISLAWGLAILVMGVGHLAAELVSTAGGSSYPGVMAVLNWGIPIVAIYATLHFTKQVAGNGATATA